jgi:hypothetical protein
MAELAPLTPTPLREELDDFYRRSGLITHDGADCPSYEGCRASCVWDGDRKITPPTGAYVGQDYEPNRLLFVGINTNRGSASSETFYDSCYWISGAETAESSGIDGVIHRLTCTILGEPRMRPEQTRKCFAFTNLIKCSVKTQAGRPTRVMKDSCQIRHGFLFDEIDILKPRMIVAMGEAPYYAISDHFIQTVREVEGGISGYMFQFRHEARPVVVWFAYNPGARAPRTIWKAIRTSNIVPDGYRRFMPKGVSDRDLRAFLDNKYAAEQHVDAGNLFYQMMLDRLIEAANRFLRQTS